MGWWSDLFKRGSQKPIFINATILPADPWPREATGTYHTDKNGNIQFKPKDISEPVLAIVKAMKDRPSSFKVKRNSVSLYPGSIPVSYTVKDIKTGESIQALKRGRFVFCIDANLKNLYTLSWQWLTEEEQSLLIKTCYDIQENKLDRLRSLREVRENIANKEERSRLKEIYK